MTDGIRIGGDEKKDDSGNRARDSLSSSGRGEDLARDDINAMSTAHHGWKKLKEEEQTGSGNTTVRTAGKRSDEIVQIEMCERQSTSNAAAPHCSSASATARTAPLEDADVGGDGTVETTGVKYKVYKRRWFGLVQLTLLNIIVSWDVRDSPLLLS